MANRLIIFVHGLGGSAETWQEVIKRFSEDGMLSSHFKLDCFVYKTGIFRSWLPFTSVVSITDAAGSLVSEVEKFSSIYEKIFIVAHSLGGLIVKKAVIDLLKKERTSRVAGVIFYASPHYGSLLAKIAAIVFPGHPQLQALVPNSEVKSLIHDKWVESARLITFPMINIIGDADIAVDPHSARECSGAEFFVKVPNRGHVDICTPKSAGDCSFRALRHFVLGEFDLIPNLIVDDHDGPFFSPRIRAHFEKLNKTVEKLTDEQYSLITNLRGHHQVAVSGCAGSGKTLVAAEKARRLAVGGNSVLILCHSPNLAAYIRTFSGQTEVYSFHEWISKITENAVDTHWQPGDTLADEDIDFALNWLTNGTREYRYDAIIVDEGQDFRDSWWEVILQALRTRNHTFFVFYDKFQKVYDHAGNIPKFLEKRELNRNCRNGGYIFEVVARLNPDAPMSESALAGKGRFIALQAPGGDQFKEFFCSQLEHVLRIAELTNLAIVTPDQDDAARTMLHGIEVNVQPNWRWQDSLTNWMNYTLSVISGLPDAQISGLSNARTREFMSAISPFRRSKMPVQIDKHYRYRDPPSLSNRAYPTQADVAALQNWAEVALSNLDQGELHSTARWAGWAGWRYIAFTRNRGEIALNHRTNGAIDHIALLNFLRGDWTQGLPQPKRARIVHYRQYSGDDGQIPLYDVEAIKGLEKEVVVFAMPDLPAAVEEKLYIGISRARAVCVLLTGPQVSQSGRSSIKALGICPGDIADKLQ